MPAAFLSTYPNLGLRAARDLQTHFASGSEAPKSPLGSAARPNPRRMEGMWGCTRQLSGRERKGELKDELNVQINELPPSWKATASSIVSDARAQEAEGPFGHRKGALG